jgi:hypothetical protein
VLRGDEHRPLGVRGECVRDAPEESAANRALLGDLLSGGGFLLIDLALVRYRDDERACSGQQ